MREAQLPDGTACEECIYTPHSLRATTATLPLDAGVDITKVQELLGRRHISTTQIYAETSLHGMGENYIRALAGKH